MFRILLIIQFIFGSQILLAETLPRVLRHSEQVITAYQGDQVTLKIVPDPNLKEAQWWLGKKKLCMSNTCQINTEDLSPGVYKVMSIVENDQGSKLINFQIKIKELLDNRPPKVISPKLIESDDEQTSYDEKKPYIYAMKGTGFVWRRNKLQFIKTSKRNLDWNEKLKSSGSILSFGTTGKDQYFLLPGSTVRLINYKDQHVTMLGSGFLRFRSRDGNQTASQSIVIGDWLQIDVESYSDFAVDYKPGKESVDILVFSGQIRLIKFLGKGKKNQAASQYLPAGVKLNLRKKGSFHKNYKIIPLNQVNQIFQTTSPELLLTESTFLNSESSLFKGVDYRNPLKTAEALITARRYSVALEVLATAEEILRKMAQWHLLVGQALGEINLARESLSILKPQFQKQKNAMIAMLIGLRYFENRDWEKAKEWFEISLDLDSLSSRHISLYYLAIIAFRDKDYPVADRYFKETEWYADSLDIIESSRGFIDLISYYNDWGIDLTLLARLDSNIFRTSNKEQLAFQSDITGLSGVGYDARLHAWWYLFHTRVSNLKFGYDINRLGWLKSSLFAVTFVDQKAYSAFSFGKDLYFKGKLALTTKVLGSSRAADGLVMENRMGWKSIFLKPELSLNLGLFKDPEPGKNDLLDPISFELQQTASDRSSRITQTGLDLFLWEAPRQKILSNIMYESREFTNTLVKSESYNRIGIGFTFQQRFWGLSRILSGSDYIQKTLPNASRTDRLIKLHSAYSFDMEHDGNFRVKAEYEIQESNISEYSYRRLLISTGIDIMI